MSNYCVHHARCPVVVVRPPSTAEHLLLADTQ
ncbi:MAG: hypothetical protein ABSG36_04915 [Acidimicrobiales bacterium]